MIRLSNKTQLRSLIMLIVLTLFLTSCSNFEGSNKVSSLTGWRFNDPTQGNFLSNQDYIGQETPMGMVVVEGGTFTMGHVQDDVMGDWNSTPKRVQIRTFFMDEAEVSNNEYVFYLQWLEKVFPPSNPKYKHIYSSALPDTLSWLNTLSNNELLTENYLRHPAYANYPVVGVSWLQANDYCKWRTNRVNERILNERGVLKNLFDLDSIKVEGENNFNTDTYLANPDLLFSGDSTIYGRGIRTNNPAKDNTEFGGRHVNSSDGIIRPKFRLPTESEWEYAAKSISETREYSNIKSRKKYPWLGKYTRDTNNRYKGDQLANFKQRKGDYSGISGWSSDNAAITNKIKSYKPNIYGLYDMAGNVAEWVADVYRQDINTDASDFNYYRGNIYFKKAISEDGKLVTVTFDNIEYDTLQNGRIVVKQLPGSIKKVQITPEDAFMRTNYSMSDNVNITDGDKKSTRFYDATRLSKNQRMYNSPDNSETKNNTGEDSKYDKKVRNTLVSDHTRVYKGGSWRDREYWMDPSQRRYLPEFMATNYIGFRCATDKLGAHTINGKTPKYMPE